METNSPADEPPPAIPSETPAAEAVPSEVPAEENFRMAEPVESGEAPILSAEETDELPPTPDGSAPADELSQLAAASQKSRLSPAEEERMAVLLKEALQAGRGGVARAIEALPKVPWIVGVRAVEAIWPELTAGFRTQLLAGLGKDESDASRRIRLSLARALFKIDAAVSLKIAVAVARELRNKETGLLGSKQAQIFANVFIGRGKPWLAQIALADLKPADGDALTHCAVLAVFALPHPPVTQLGVLKWAREQERLDKLDPLALEAAKKGVARWSAKWQSALRREVSDLPAEIVDVLKPLPEPAAAAEQRVTATESNESAEGVEAGAAEDPDAEDEDEDEEETDEEEQGGIEDAEGDEEDEDEDEDEVPKPRPVYEPRPQRPAAERPVYTPRNAGGVPRNFNLGEALRHIDGHVQSLRAELSATQAKLRGREDRRPDRPDKSAPIIEGQPTPEELARLNLQLVARNAELQQRLSDLTQHSEDVAVNTGVLTGEPVSDAAAQLRTLLALKLQEDFADFLALEKEASDLVVQQHYKALLRHVFEVLQQLEVPLKAE